MLIDTTSYNLLLWFNYKLKDHKAPQKLVSQDISAEHKKAAKSKSAA